MNLEQYLESRYTKQTRDSYLYTIQNYLALHPKAKSYEYQDVVDFMNELEQEYRDDYCSRVLSSIKVYYNYLVETNQRNDHPCRNLSKRVPKRNKVQLQDLFSSDELENLLHRENRYKHIDSRNNVLISLFIYQGLASREVINLKLKDINLDEASITVRATSKTNKRVLMMHPKQTRYFMEYMDVRSNLTNNIQETLIINKLGNPMTICGLRAVFSQFKLMYSGRKLCPTTIRQSVIANWLNEKGKSLEEAQELAGHRFISTTEQYLKQTNASNKALINRFHPLNR